MTKTFSSQKYTHINVYIKNRSLQIPNVHGNCNITDFFKRKIVCNSSTFILHLNISEVTSLSDCDIDHYVFVTKLLDSISMMGTKITILEF